MNSAKVVHAMERDPEFLERACRFYADARRLSVPNHHAAATALGVTTTTLNDYRRRALAAEDPEDPFLLVISRIEAEERRFLAEKMPTLLEAMEKESPSNTRKALFPRLAAETDREMDGARMAGWVLAFLEEFQEDMRHKLEELAAERLGDDASDALAVVYEAMDHVIERHSRDAEAER